MQKIIVPSKINLYLHIVNIIKDGTYKGYHQLDSLVYFDYNFYDELYIEQSDKTQINIDGPFSSHIDLHQNTLTKAIKLLQDTTSSYNNNAKIRLVKNIPIGAGLGGGSSDAAKLLIALNDLWKLKLSIQDLQEISIKIGADVPVCVYGKTAQITGIGEIVNPIDLDINLDLEYKYTDIPLLTKNVYTHLIVNKNQKILDIPKIKNIYDLIEFLKKQKNDLEEPAIKLMPEIKNNLNYFAQDPNYIFTRMTGSGNCVFAIKN